MALVFLIGIALGWFVRPPRRAEVGTYTVGFGAFVALSLLWSFSSGRLQVSPFEPLVLVVGTPFAGALASWIARWRLSRRSPQNREQGSPRTIAPPPSIAHWI